MEIFETLAIRIGQRRPPSVNTKAVRVRRKYSCRKYSCGDALREGLPHLTDPASLQDQSFGKQPQGIGIQSEQGKKYNKQKKRTRTTSQATQTTHPLLLAADAFAAALGALPAEDWCRTLAAGRTIILRRTSAI
jgi:hypothetical protein